LQSKVINLILFCSLVFYITTKNVKMKKIIFAFIGFGFITNFYSQEDGFKRFQLGIVTGFGMNFNKSETKYVSRSGVGSDFTFGANLIYNFSETAGICTGLEFDFERFRYTSGTEPIYYYHDDTRIIENQNLDFTSPKQRLFQMTERQQRANYLTIPAMIILKTKEIGYLQYFGKFGGRFSFLTSSRMNDSGFEFKAADEMGFTENTYFGTATKMENMNMRAPKDLSFMKVAAGLSAGAIWNFSGSTSLMFEMGYYYGFTQIHRGESLTNPKDKNMTLHTFNSSDMSRDFIALRAKQSQLLFKVSILF
jgi:hypothetical protein